MRPVGDHEPDGGITREPHGTLRALIVVSRVTFVPDNYDDLVCTLAECPQVAGLLILDNRSIKLIRQVVGLLLLGARRLGATVLRNSLGHSDARRRQVFARAGKPVWQLATINCPEAVELVSREGIDLIVNSRTRDIYRQEILSAPRLGCINIHHGLLPDQRGTMCDLWALSQGNAAGFSIHQMSHKIDEGGIIRCVQLSTGEERDYREYLRHSTLRESSELPAVLAEIERRDAVTTQPNTPTVPVVMHRDPTPAQIRAMIREGMRI